jgi:hypothetical protein
LITSYVDSLALTPIYRITNPDYCRLTHTDSRIASRELSGLVEKELLAQHGIGRWTYYTLIELTARPGKIAAATKLVKRKDRSNDIYIFIKEHQPVNRIAIAQGLRIQPAAASYWLRKLIKANKIGYTTSSKKDPAVKYIIKK